MKMFETSVSIRLTVLQVDYSDDADSALGDMTPQ